MLITSNGIADRSRIETFDLSKYPRNCFTIFSQSFVCNKLPSSSLLSSKNFNLLSANVVSSLDKNLVNSPLKPSFADTFESKKATLELPDEG